MNDRKAWFWFNYLSRHLFWSSASFCDWCDVILSADIFPPKRIHTYRRKITIENSFGNIGERDIVIIQAKWRERIPGIINRKNRNVLVHNIFFNKFITTKPPDLYYNSKILLTRLLRKLSTQNIILISILVAYTVKNEMLSNFQ